MTSSKKAISRMLHDLADKIGNGECAMEDEEIVELSSMIMHRKMYQEPLSQYYGITRVTLERWVSKGKLPSPRRDGNGRIFWWLDECDEQIRRWNREHDSQ